MKNFPTDVLAIFETHAGGDNARRICQGLGFDNSFRVDAAGQSGGLWLLWRSEVGVVEVVKSTDQFIHAKLVKDMDILQLIVVYAAPSASRRSGLWNELREVIQGVNEPLLIGGDFNIIVRVDERTGGNGQLSSDSLEFGDWINEMALIDMGFRGNKYTWRRGKVTNNYIAKRLDRVLCCPQLRLKFQEALVSHLPFLSSDHAPMYVQLSPVVSSNTGRRPFRFEAAWLQHPGFQELLEISWDRGLSTPAALNALKKILRKWNREVFGDVQRRKDGLLNKIKSLQDQLDIHQTDSLLEEEAVLINELEVVLAQEEVMWFQKSREKWITLGDRNTKYFHTSTVVRRRRNRIEALKDDEGRWITTASDLEKLAVDYYKRLYSLLDVEQVVEKLPAEGFNTLTDVEKRALDKPVLECEIFKSIQSMGKYKAPGPDGFQPVFYQQNWEVIGPSVVRFALDFFASGCLPPGTNDALLVLIAKVDKPEKITQFRPISLCNVLFKIITKTLVMRLKQVMPKLIGPA